MPPPKPNRLENALTRSATQRVRLRFPSSAAAHDATWRAAKCQEQLGDVTAARHGYEALLRVASHARRAQQALATLSGGDATPQ